MSLLSDSPVTLMTCSSTPYSVLWPMSTVITLSYNLLLLHNVLTPHTMRSRNSSIPHRHHNFTNGLQVHRWTLHDLRISVLSLSHHRLINVLFPARFVFASDIDCDHRNCVFTPLSPSTSVSNSQCQDTTCDEIASPASHINSSLAQLT